MRIGTFVFALFLLSYGEEKSLAAPATSAPLKQKFSIPLAFPSKALRLEESPLPLAKSEGPFCQLGQACADGLGLRLGSFSTRHRAKDRFSGEVGEERRFPAQSVRG
ncbi:MAG: hypothetical protein WDN67_01445 [Candidatus Moraniibacteriota bacterium]